MTPASDFFSPSSFLVPATSAGVSLLGRGISSGGLPFPGPPEVPVTGATMIVVTDAGSLGDFTARTFLRRGVWLRLRREWDRDLREGTEILNSELIINHKY